MSETCQDRLQSPTTISARLAVENGIYPLAQGPIVAGSGPESFSENEFWSLVRRLSGFQSKLRLSDSTFCRMHTGVGSTSSWRLLKLLAEEKHLDLSRWYRRLKIECDRIERAGIPWIDTAAEVPDRGQRSRLECQELVAKLDAWRKSQRISQTRFLHDYHDYTGDAATWHRLRKGRWDLVNLPKRLSLLRELCHRVCA
jgi:hypothetical protein